MDEEVEGLFNGAPQLSPVVSAQIRARIRRDTLPAEPMMNARAYGMAFSLIFATAATLFASVLGMGGLRALPFMAEVVIVTLLLLQAVWAGLMLARSMRPASGTLHSWISGALAVAAYEVFVITFFRDYSMTKFTHSGVICMMLGVLCATLTALPAWLLVRRGLVVNPTGAGAILGLLSGLAGLAALTMHCPILSVPHTAIWHAAILVVCVGTGAIVGKTRSI